ncbi:hypothetical protein, partial [Brevibacillus sp. MCWH]|uniref:hypothetical protein n=1 Tax=Brevibacillus sp. MCWH TaxID=2508871 RepID=UPI00149207BA
MSGNYTIYACCQLTNGTILVAGFSGRWELYDSDMDYLNNGMWNFAGVDIRDIIDLGDKLLLVGTWGRWALYNYDMTLINSGTWDHGSSEPIYKAIKLSNNNIALFGSSGRWNLFNINMSSISRGTFSSSG